MNILSLDIDYAYSPTISAYDDYVVGSAISTETQQKIFKDKNLPEPKVNPQKIKLLKSKLAGKIEHESKIVLANHHHCILDYLPLDKEFSLYNIDHHHDIFYPGWHTLEILDEGNWAHRLEKFQCKKYTWIRNKDSENLEPSVSLNFNYVEEYLDNIILPSFGFVFCCSSPHWTGDAGKKNLLNLLGEIL